MINTRDGVKTTPLNLLNAARSFGASEWQIFMSIVLPSTVPFILTGLRLAVGRALIGVLVGELYAAMAGAAFAVGLVLARGCARETCSNVRLLLVHWRVAGFTPHAQLTLASSDSPRLAYAVPILAGTVVAIWLR